MPVAQLDGPLLATRTGGRLDGTTVEAVFAADGHGDDRRRPAPGRLSEREVEVLRLIARGWSIRDVAGRLDPGENVRPPRCRGCG